MNLQEPSSWTIELSLPLTEPTLVPLAPLPSTLPLCLIALRVPRSTAFRSHLIDTISGLKGTAGARGLTPLYFSAGEGPELVRWFVIGALVHGGAPYETIMRVIAGADRARGQRLRLKGHLLVIDPRTHEELDLYGPSAPLPAPDTQDGADDEDPLGARVRAWTRGRSKS